MFEFRLMVAGLVMGASAGAAVAQESAETEDADVVIVTGYGERQLLLDVETEAGSRLGLTARETPAIVDILSERQLAELGARTTVEAFNRAPGFTSSYAATSPGQITLRGFTGNSSSLLYDGISTIAYAFATRSLDSWAFDRIEILKGPSSVVHGDGALAGAVNLVPKKPHADEMEFAGLLEGGSFGAGRAAVDLNAPLGGTSATRFVASHAFSEGYIDDASTKQTAAALSFTVRPLNRLTLDLAADYSEDSYETPYMGTPLVSAAVARAPSDIVDSGGGLVLDESLRELNANVSNGVASNEAFWLRTRAAYELDGGWSLTNDLSYYTADRLWRNAEVFTFNATTNLVDRSTGIVTHDIESWTERLALNSDAEIAGHRNRFVLGAQYSELDFFSNRRFGSTTALDPYQPVRGQFPVGDNATIFPSRTDTGSTINTTAIFVEDAFNITPPWLVLAGARAEQIDFNRYALNLNTTPAALTLIEKDFDPVSWRIGTVYDLLPKTQVFAQYSSAFVPVASLVLLSPANAQFDVTTGRSAEIGVKSSFLDDRVDLTVSAYDIEQDDIVTRDPADPNVTVQGGKQSSKGVELSLSASLTSQLRVDANYTRLDARFDELIEAGGADRRGRTPARIPEEIGNLFAIYRFDAIPLSVSATVHHVGRFYLNNANTTRVSGYTALDAAVGYRFDFGELTLRGRNLTDELYGEPQDLSAGQLTLGAPRSFDVSFSTRF